MIYVAMAVGAFYVFAGFVVMRAMALDRLMDQVLAALDDPRGGKEALRSRILTVGAFLTLASGVGLALLSPLALPLFLANLAVQGGYLVWAAFALKPEDADEAKGRQQTKNAFVVYLAATAFVVWLSVQGYLRPWSAGAVAIATDACVAVLAVAAAWAFIHVPRRKGSAGVGDVPLGTALADYQPRPIPTRLRLAPAYSCSPL